mgnify:FL=1
MNTSTHIGTTAVRLLGEGKKVALVTVLQTWGSSPRPVGSQLVVCEDGTFFGSVSGGCVEGAVVLEALGVLKNGICRFLEYGVSNHDAFSVGLACGGNIQLMIEPVGFGQGIDVPTLETLNLAYSNRQAIAMKVNLKTWLRELIYPDAYPRYFIKDVGQVNKNVYLHVQKPSLRLIIIGAVHIAQSLAPMAQLVGYNVIVIDPREAFACPKRFPNQELIVEWPADILGSMKIDDRTAVVTLTHDPKMDLPLLEEILKTNAFYIGALGSLRTHNNRRESMLALGITAESFDRIQGPVGLQIGSKSPSEIALSILAAITTRLRIEMS